MLHDKLEDFILHNQEAFDTELPPTTVWGRIETALSEDDDTPGDLEAFVATHREAFDDATPPPRLEETILLAATEDDSATPTPAAPLHVSHSRRRSLLPILGMAASALVLIVAAFLFGNNRGYRTAEQELIATEIAEINPEFAETERFYQSEIATQLKNVKQVSNDPQLFTDLKEIDRATAEIRADLITVPIGQRPALVEELIRVYRTKLDILLRIQRQLTPSGTPTPQSKNNEI